MPIVTTESSLEMIVSRINKRARNRLTADLSKINTELTQFINRHTDVSQARFDLVRDVQSVIDRLTKDAIKSYERDEMERFMKQVAEIENITGE